MSYSFGIIAASKAEAVSKAGDELAKIVAAQPVHEADHVRALAVVETYLNILADPAEGEEIHLNVSGYVSWREEGVFTGASINVSANIARTA